MIFSAFSDLCGESTELVVVLHYSQKLGHILKAEVRF